MSASLLDLVTVKPLGWVQNGAVHRANSYTGIEYEIQDVGSRFQLTTRVRSKERTDFFSTLEAAKALAQANFDARILSALAFPADTAARDVLAERRRQVETEGWMPEHDDDHGRGEMARAASCYAYEASRTDHQRTVDMEATPIAWPWAVYWWKPTTRRRDLVKAGALIIAEIERLDRRADRVIQPTVNQPGQKGQPLRRPGLKRLPKVIRK